MEELRAIWGDLSAMWANYQTTIVFLIFVIWWNRKDIMKRFTWGRREPSDLQEDQPERHDAAKPSCDPLNGARCPEIKGMLQLPETLRVIQTDISEIKAHEKASRDFLVQERAETRKDVESLFDLTRDHDKDLAALKERTKEL